MRDNLPFRRSLMVFGMLLVATTTLVTGCGSMIPDLPSAHGPATQTDAQALSPNDASARTLVYPTGASSVLGVRGRIVASLSGRSADEVLSDCPIPPALADAQSHGIAAKYNLSGRAEPPEEAGDDGSPGDGQARSAAVLSPTDAVGVGGTERPAAEWYEEGMRRLEDAWNLMETTGSCEAEAMSAAEVFSAINAAAGKGPVDYGIEELALYRYPETAHATIAFESAHRYDVPRFDGDYNDFVAAMTAYTIVDQEGHLLAIRVRYEALAGENRPCVMVLNLNRIFEGNADIALFRFESASSRAGDLSLQEFPSDASEILVFANTGKALNADFDVDPDVPDGRGGKVTTASLILQDPFSNPLEESMLPPYAPYFRRDPNEQAYTRLREVDANTLVPSWIEGAGEETSYPFIVIIPEPWEWSPKHVFIETAYPRFYGWRTSQFTEQTDWYRHPTDPATLRRLARL